MLCKECNVNINGSRFKKFCSKKCGYKFWTKLRSPKYGEVKCVECRLFFPKRTSTHRFCSRGCHTSWWLKKRRVLQNDMQINCFICQKAFKPTSLRSKYCSPKCKYNAELARRSKKPKTKRCKYCDAVFKPYTSLDKFCRAECRIESQKSNRSKNWTKASVEKIKGKNNPAYRNGFYTQKKKRNYYGQYKFEKERHKIMNHMLESSGYLYCQNCGINQSLRWECHHIIFRSEKPKHKNLHHPLNLIFLCIKCHNWFHKKKDRRGFLVKERNLEALFA